ncbi:hypothetical protein [Gloeothece verrucosa]|uniref:Uncharacterized protein n=1 Tax=Gloeothece verrucosa (strain PCC 7822) TaxID=497965 RepID=E0UM86_GLOV7|nr:hypothetical protein [Gloeothece verrucosa]ADN18066.1 hypothetical protein Cyan7822_6266 [Gloeothece verrucosa PCC 7822]
MQTLRTSAQTPQTLNNRPSNGWVPWQDGFSSYSAGVLPQVLYSVHLSMEAGQ